MAKIRYYTDEQVSRAVIRGLRARGIDVQTVPEAGLMGASDQAHLDFARASGRVIFTHDTDFLSLAASGQLHAGIVYTHQRTPVGRIITGLVLIYRLLEAEEMENRIEFI